MGKKLVNKVLVIGWDAADWKVIMPLMQEGKMPALKSLMEDGVHGRVKTMDPPLSPMLWTSMATGMRPDKHGIKGFIEPTPDGKALRPVTSTSRRVKAIWNILNQNNMRSNVVSWWPSNPAEPIDGVMVSNLYQVANKELKDGWEMPDGTIHPESMIEPLKELRVHPQELTAPMLTPFLPEIFKKEGHQEEKRTLGVAKTLANAASVHAASTYLQRETEWDFMAVYHDAIDHFCHLAMRFHPPRRPFIKEDEYEKYKGVVEAGYRFHDMMLERTLDLIDDDTTVILISDHGFHSDHLRPMVIPKEPSGPAVEHSPYGILVMKGPGIRKGGTISGASIIDLTPTLLTLYGLPVGKDMEGKVLTAAFDQPVVPEYIDSWELVNGNSGMHKKELVDDPWASQEAMKQLVELGYIEPMEGDTQDQVDKAVRESKYYLARSLVHGKKLEEGIKVLEEIFFESHIPRYGKRLASAYLETGQFSKCEKLIEELKVAEKEEFEMLKKERLEKDPNDPFGDKELEEPMYLEYIEGLLLLAQNKVNKAIPILEKVLERVPSNLGVCLNIAKTQLSRDRFDEAEKYYIKALAIDELNAGAHYGLGYSFLRRNMLDEAIDEFLITIELNFQHVRAHYHLGEALARKNDYANAVNAFEVAVKLAPGMKKAHNWLAHLYKDQLNMPEKAAEHEKFVDENIVGQIYVVSGLPRSGTSMMMQMLSEGGAPMLTDEQREADINNPKGYMEYEKVKKLHLDQTWLDEAQDKTVKVVAPLLHFLPEKFAYKVILMERDLSEVITSQQKMLGKDTRKDTLPMALFTAYKNQLTKVESWAESQPKVKVLRVQYSNVIQNPLEEAERIAAFLELPLDVRKMASVVDPELYRNKV